ncbi:MAG: DUF1844 domain-containing protein [Armatimonadota bacterium]
MAGEQEEEKTYEVKDKRRINPDGTLRDTAEEQDAQKAESQQQAAGSTAQSAGEQVSEIPLPRVYDLMHFMVGMLAEQAWVRMGIRLAPGYKEPEKDMAQAKVAIDTIVFVVDKIAPHLDEADRRSLRALVSDLQINFVKQSS